MLNFQSKLKEIRCPFDIPTDQLIAHVGAIEKIKDKVDKQIRSNSKLHNKAKLRGRIDELFELFSMVNRCISRPGELGKAQDLNLRFNIPGNVEVLNRRDVQYSKEGDKDKFAKRFNENIKVSISLINKYCKIK